MRLIPRAPALAVLALLTSTPLAAQLQPPKTWRWRTDTPVQLATATDRIQDSTLAFVEMPPGWHVTMGPGGVLFDPRYFADGAYSIESNIFHFPNSSNAEYGLAVELEATIEEIHQTIHAHPTLSEAVMEAAAASSGEAIHI